LTLEEKAQAAKLIDEEYEKEEKQLEQQCSPQLLNKIWEDTNKNIFYLPSRKQFDRFDLAKTAERVQALQQEFEILREKVSQENIKAKKN